MDTLSHQAAIGSQPSKPYNPLPSILRRQNLASAHYKAKANTRSDINLNQLTHQAAFNYETSRTYNPLPSIGTRRLGRVHTIAD